MNNKAINEITLKQYVIVICQTQIGIGILTLPRDLAKIAGSDGWISIILGWLLALLVSLIVIKIMERNPGSTLFDLLIKYFGKWIGKGLSVLWILYAAYLAVVVLFSSAQIISTWIMPNVKNFILIILFLIPNYMIIKHGLRMVGFFAELVFFSLLWVPLLLLYGLKDIEWMYLLPIGQEGLLPILSAVKSTVLSFLGFETAFILYPFLKEKKSAFKGVIIANTVSLLTFLLVTVICFVKFAPEEVVEYMYPTLNLMKVTYFPFVERLEIIFLPFYLFSPFMTITPYFYIAVLGTHKIMGNQSYSKILIVVMLLCIGLSFFLSPSSSQIEQMNGWISKLGIYFAFLFPFALWSYGKLFDLKNRVKKL